MFAPCEPLRTDAAKNVFVKMVLFVMLRRRNECENSYMLMQEPPKQIRKDFLVSYIPFAPQVPSVTSLCLIKTHSLHEFLCFQHYLSHTFFSVTSRVSITQF